MSALIYIAICIIIPVGMVLLGEILGKKNPSSLKSIPFECGIIPKETSESSFVIPYFGYALLFLIFDVDIVLFYFLIGNKISLLYFLLIFLFIVMGFLGIVLAYKIGAFKWD